MPLGCDSDRLQEPYIGGVLIAHDNGNIVELFASFRSMEFVGECIRTCECTSTTYLQITMVRAPRPNVTIEH